MTAVPSVALEALPLLYPLLKDRDERVRNAAAKAFPFNEAVKCLKDEDKSVRDLVEVALLFKLKNTEEREALTHEHAPALLHMMHMTIGVAEWRAQALKEAAQKILKTLAEKIDEEGLAWITSHFDELPECPEKKPFFTTLYRRALSEGELTSIKQDFIIHCIRHGLTTSVTRNGNIIFDGTTYPFSAHSQKYLGAIVEAAFSQSDDLLAIQYRNHQPLFPNTSAGGMLVAASDIPDVKSLTGRASLTVESALLTSLTLHSAASSGNQIILFEKRNPFGDRVAYRFSNQGKILVRQEVHPSLSLAADRQMRESLFGGADTSTYKTQSALLSEPQVRALLAWRERCEASSSGIAGDFMFFVNTLLSSSASLEVDSARRTGAESAAASPKPPLPYFINKIVLLGIDPASHEGLSFANKAQLGEHEEALQQGGVYDKAAVKRGFEALEEASQAYFKTYYWTMINLLEAYQNLSTGLIAGNLTKDVSKVEFLGKKTANAAVNAGVNAVVGLTKGIPLVGNVIGALQGIVETLYDAVKQNKLDNQANMITNLIKKKLVLADDVSLSLAKVALSVAEAKKEALLHPQPILEDKSVGGKLTSSKKWLISKVDALKKTVLPSVELHDKDSPAVQMALEDVAVTMAYLFTHYETILADGAPLDQQLAAIVREDGLERLLDEAGRGEPGSTSSASVSREKHSAQSPEASPAHSRALRSTPATQSPANHDAPDKPQKKKKDGSKCVLQ